MMRSVRPLYREKAVWWKQCLLSIFICVLSFAISSANATATYGSDWTAWDQLQGDEQVMKDYGCWVVAQARLLCASGFESSASFNPDNYLAWERANGEIDSGFYQTDSSGGAVIRYANQYRDSKGMELCSESPAGSNVKEKIWNSVNDGYYTIVHYSTGSVTGHYVLINNDASKSQGRLICYQSGGFASNDINDSSFTGVWSYSLKHLKYTVTFNPNGGVGEEKAIEKEWSESLVLSTSTVSFHKTNYFIDHWATDPNDEGAKYYLGDDLKGVNTTLYAIWLEAIPPVVEGEIYAKDIEFNQFTITFKATDNVGVSSVRLQISPYIVPSNKKFVSGSYDASSSTASIHVKLDNLKFRSDLYNLVVIVRDAAGNTCTVEIQDPFSPWIINTNDKGIWKARYDSVHTYATPTASGTFNGVSQIKRSINSGEKFDMLGSIQAGGVSWLRIGTTNEFVKQSDFQYDTFSNLWNNILEQFVLVLGGQNVYAVEGPYGSIRLNGNHSSSTGLPSGRPGGSSTADPTNTNENVISVSSENFPDNVFRNYISTNIDANHDGVLSEAEIDAVKEINLSGNYYVYSLAGIEQFKNLELLNCSNQHISSLDLSANTALVTLICSGNSNVTLLNIENNKGLAYLECNSIGLQTLDLTNNCALEYVSCIKQGAFNIILGSCPLLKSLYCDGNGLSVLDISGCPALENLSCSINNISSLILTNNPQLIYLNCSSNPSLASLDISRCAVLETLLCSSDSLQNLDLRNNEYLLCLNCNNNINLTSLNVSKNSHLKELQCRFCALSQIDVSNNSELNEFWCCGNGLTSLDVSHNLKLGHLYCVQNQLDVLDVTHNPALWGLSCGVNQLTELDLSNNPLLSDLSCYDNQIPFIDLSHNPELTGLRIYDNKLTSIDLTHNDKLGYVWADNNGTEVESYIDLNDLPGFDITRISNITGGILVGHYLLLTEEAVHYDYECNETYTVNFFLTGEPESVIDSGSCGNNVLWTLYGNGLLLITGEGEMSPFVLQNNAPRCTAPWYVYESDIKMVYVDQGVTNVSSNAFWNCSALKSVYLSDSVNTIADRAFCGCFVLEDVIIPSHVGTIGEFAFLGCKHLSQITIPASVTMIGEGAFSSSGIQSVQIDASITQISPSMFSGCRQLVTVVLPDTVTSIGDQAFHLCESLGNIYIPAGVVTIGNNSFSSCYNLKDLTIPNTVTTIGDSAFSFCRSLTSIRIPTGILRIQNNTFGFCDSLVSIEIPDGVTEIGRRAFQECSSLTNIDIPNSVVSIGENAFYNSGLTSIMIPVNVADIGDAAFSTNSLTEFRVNTDNQFFSDENNALYNKDKTKLIAIPKEWTSFVIPEGVTEIGTWACYGCKLVNVKMPNSLTTIGAYAFHSCWRVDHYVIPKNVTYIGVAAFWCCEMSSITIHKSVTTIKSGAFDQCTSLKDVYYTGNEEEWASINIEGSNEKLLSATIHYNAIPGANDETIIASGTCGENAYWKLDTDGTLTVYGSGDISTSSFIPQEHREKVKNVIVEAGITGVGNYTFHGCGNLLTVQLPEGLTYIGGQAFEYCEELTSINIPASLKQIGSFAFAFCRKLNTLILPENVSTTVFTRMYEGTLIEITLPSSVEELQYGAFIEAVGVGQRINISIDFDVPEFVSIIDAEAFEGISATAVSVFTKWDRSLVINSRAFANCKRLQYFWIYGEGPEELHIADDAFAGCNGTMTIISGFIEDSLAEQLEQYASEHGFQYLENEKYWGNG